MKIINASEKFVLNFNADEYTIPNGEFEVFNEKLVNHILFVANKWGKDVKTVPNSESLEIKKVETLVSEPIVAGASTESLPKKMGRPKKNVESIA